MKRTNRTIKIILKKRRITIYTIEKARKDWKCNWCWGKKGFNFSKYFDENIHKFKFFKFENNFSEDLKIICDLHDLDFIKWKTFFDFIKANYILAKNIKMLLNWTWFFRKNLVSIIIFLWVTTFWWDYFKDKTLW